MTEQIWNADAITYFLNAAPGTVSIMATDKYGFEMVEIVGTFAEIERLAIAGREFSALRR